jgi:hypothetical protein
MTLTCDQLRHLQSDSPKKAWEAILSHAWETCSAPFGGAKPESEVPRRDREVADLDLFLATAGWDLWEHYEPSVPLTTDALADWWSSRGSGRAVLILDALSLREAPWLLAGAAARGFTIHDARATGAELPADTTPFAKALGFGQRSSLGANAAGFAHRLPGARTECTDIAWEDCARFVGSEPDWVFWHHWPDKDVHDFADAGEGLRPLITKAAEYLAGDAFWALVDRLAEGRRLVITSDHGYAASELFPDAGADHADYLKRIYKSGRCADAGDPPAAWVPPIDLLLKTRHGPHLFVNGRRKWKSAGGYPTLTHGGLSVLEVAVPFIELSKTHARTP